MKNVNRRILKISIFGFYIFFAIIFIACSSNRTQNWNLDNLEEIDGHDVTVFGNPEIIDTDIGKAIKFDGDGDLMLVDFNPLGNTNEFTAEVIFKPEASYPENIAPRFIHIQDPDDPEKKRLMIELRLNEKNECYLDGFLNTDTSELTLIDEKLVHPTEVWLHAAVTYKDKILTTYINGDVQLTGNVGYENSYINPTGKVAIGGRMNKVNWFRGTIKSLRFSNVALEPKDFVLAKDLIKH